jgi:hypothetical protein
MFLRRSVISMRRLQGCLSSYWPLMSDALHAGCPAGTRVHACRDRFFSKLMYALCAF